MDERERESALQAAMSVINEVKSVVKGKDEIIVKVMLAILARGNILLEDIPGVGKTTLALAFSRAMQLKYNRIQFTPDVMPSDVTGYSIYRKETGNFEFIKGAVMCNLLLADEINRTSSKTQAALLQVMEEGRVTVDMQTYSVPQPFTVIATQNPIGHAGTQLLPESQLDRFIMRLSMGYPDRQSEVEILLSKQNGDALERVRALISVEDIIKMQAMVDDIYVDKAIYTYMVDLVNATRNHELIVLGASPRGTICLANVSKAIAFLDGRSYLIPADVQAAFCDVIAHRIVLKSKARMVNAETTDILAEILQTVRPPQVNNRARVQHG